MFLVNIPNWGEYAIKVLLGKGDSNAKLMKSDNADAGYLTVGLSLSPAKESGYEVCSSRSAGCTKACLFTAGQGAFSTVKRARIAKTILFFEQREAFLNKLTDELVKHSNRSDKNGKRLAVRLNMLSDIQWESIHENLFWHFGNVQFYDYTKHYKRMRKYLAGQLPKNYHLTFSRSECNDKEAIKVLDNGGNVAVVFDNGLPNKWHGYTVINGDETDMRFADAENIVVGLKAKGKAKKDDSGFVVNNRLALPMAV